MENTRITKQEVTEDQEDFYIGLKQAYKQVTNDDR